MFDAQKEFDCYDQNKIQSEASLMDVLLTSCTSLRVYIELFD